MSATYVNTEGRVQMTTRAVQPKGEAREGWAIFRALSSVMGNVLPYDTGDDLRAVLRGKAGENTPFSGRGYAPGAKGAQALSVAPPVAGGNLGSQPLGRAVADFYLTNPIARASRTMAECSALATSLDTAVAAE